MKVCTMCKRKETDKIAIHNEDGDDVCMFCYCRYYEGQTIKQANQTVAFCLAKQTR